MRRLVFGRHRPGASSIASRSSGTSAVAALLKC
jgi:hypothetical protein